jgi:hypothetical protein
MSIWEQLINGAIAIAIYELVQLIERKVLVRKALKELFRR